MIVAPYVEGVWGDGFHACDRSSVHNNSLSSDVLHPRIGLLLDWINQKNRGYSHVKTLAY